MGIQFLAENPNIKMLLPSKGREMWLFSQPNVAENANRGKKHRQGMGARWEQTEPQGHVNKPRERHSLTIRGRYVGGRSIEGANLHRNRQTKTVFKGKDEIT